jgi:excinuclease ABC subunit C
VAYVRGGQSLGSSTFFPRGGLDLPGEVLASFLSQYYLAREAPDEVLLESLPEDADLLEQALTERAGRPVRLRSGVRGARARWLDMARSNAALGLQMRAASRATIAEQLAALAEALGLPDAPIRVECFDVSHTMGEAATASCVVFGPEGPLKSDYRRFKLRDVTPGDDYAGIREAVGRRYARVVKGESPLPGLLLIDGGAGQLREARAALAELGLADLAAVGVAKGVDRRAGQERLFLADREPPLILPADSPALRLIQRIRDEAHRFAIAGHRQRREKTRRESVLEDIAGLGPKRRRELLRAFGGLQGLRQASVEDLTRVHGIGRQLAEEVYERLNAGTEAR